MRINKLTLEGFRNYRGQTLEFDPACNVIHGENAQGKTNLLEAMVYLSCGKSPRTRTERELISFDGGEARIIGEIYSREREFITDITLRAGSRRKMTVNGVAAKNASELSEVLHTVFFSPEDLFIIRRGRRPGGNSWISPCASCGPGTPGPWRSTTGFMSTRPAFCGTGRKTRGF